MRQSAPQGRNWTGITTAGDRAAAMVEATREFPPSSGGDGQAISEVRIAYAQAGEGLGEAPPPSSLMGKAKATVASATGGQPTLLLDKLGERLAFEHAGARLYEALLSKHQAYGSFDGGPGGADLLHVLTEEYEHADLLTHAIKDLGGDPTALTPAANLAVTISAGLPQALSDPRTNLVQSLEAIIVAELADNEGWTALAQLAQQDGHDDLAEKCREAVGHERDHLRKVRTWIAAGQGRTAADADGAEMPGVTDGEEFTFSADSPVDREGYIVSEEERTEGGESGSERPRTGRSARSRSTRRDH
jgi:ferritin-like protein